MLVQLDVQGFRNLDSFRQRFAEGSHLVLGSNGAGKTSLLEAIYLLATTRSFRTSRVADCCQHGASGFALAGEIETDQRLRLDLRWQHGQRERSINGHRTSLAKYLSVLPVVAWTAADSEILVGPPLARRRFLDRGVLGLRPAAIEVLSRYRQALQQKRQLLQMGGGELRTWNRVLAAAASELIGLRSSYTQRLQEALSSVLQECDLGFGEVEISYRSSLQSGLQDPSAIEEELMAAGERERMVRKPLLGPHRDDLALQWNGHGLRQVASAGERKALGLALLAAHGRVLTSAGREAVCLLDDADAELDESRLTALWRAFDGVRQIIVTSNRQRVWSGLNIEHRWGCSAGRLLPG